MQRLVTRWFGEPFPYERSRRFGDVSIDMLALRRAIAVSCLGVGAAALLGLRSPAGAGGSLARAVIVLCAVTTVPLAVLWWRGPWPGRGLSLAFVAYSDASIAFGLVAYREPLLALAGTSLLIALGVYVTVVHSAPVILAHVVWSSTLLAVLVGRVVAEDGDVALALSAAIALIGGLAGVPLILSGAWHPMRAEAWNSLLDRMTGLLNRRGLDVYVPRMVRSRSVLVALIDLDRFKVVNDTQGHAAGDVVLQRVSARLDGGTPTSALCARIGGEEFAVVVPAGAIGPDALGALLLGLIHEPSDRDPVTGSIGITTAERPPRSGVADVWLDEVLARADGAMYAAKANGGDQVHVDRREAARPLP